MMGNEREKKKESKNDNVPIESNGHFTYLFLIIEIFEVNVFKFPI